MAEQQAVPQVPDIVVQQAPQQNLQLNDALSQVAAQATAKLPSPYTQEDTQQAPRIQPVRQFTPQNDQQRPLGQGPAQLKHTQNMNALASLSNMVGRAGQAIAQKKQDQLKVDLTDVMQAKQNAENAQTVLQQDPNNKLAQQVLAANKKRLNDILSDPKKQKGLAKALDISFTNPEDNKTPEVQAGQQAMAQVKQAGPFNASNPQEAQVAQQARVLSGAPGSAQAAPSPQHQQQQPQRPAQPQQQARSATPYADQAMARDLPSLAANPQYAAALQQRQAAQKALYTNVLPAAIRAESAQQLQSLKDGNAAARAQFTGLVSLQRETQQAAAAMARTNATVAGRLKETAARDANQMAMTQLHVNAMLKIASDKLQDPTQKNKVQQTALATVDKQISTITAERASLTTQLTNATTDADKQAIQGFLDYNTKKLKYTNDYRQQVASKIYGMDTSKDPNATKQAPAATNSQSPSSVMGIPAGIFGVAPKNATDLRSTTPVGTDESDESSEEDDSSTDTDSDDYGNP